MIQSALDRNRIISKEYRGEVKREIQREKMQSRLYGIESQRYGTPSKV